MYKLIIILYASTIIILVFNKFFRVKTNFVFSISCIIFMFSFGSMFYNPSYSDDLYRIYSWISTIREYGLKEFFNIQPSYRVLWVASSYYKFISLLPWNQALPFLTIFLELTACMCVYRKFSLKYEIKNYYLYSGLLLFFSCWNFFSAASGIRNMLAFALFFLLLYLDLVEGKDTKKCYIGYIILCFLHVSVVILVGFRTLLFCRRQKETQLLIVSCLLLYSKALSLILQLFTKLGGIRIFALVVAQLNTLVTTSTQEVIFLKRNYIKIPLMISTLLVVLLFLKYFAKENIKLELFGFFSLYIALMGIGSIYSYNLFSRLQYMALYMEIPIYCYMRQYIKVRVKNNLAYWLTWGSMRFFEVTHIIHLAWLIGIEYHHFE